MLRMFICGRQNKSWLPIAKFFFFIFSIIAKLQMLNLISFMKELSFFLSAKKILLTFPCISDL